MDTQSFWKWQEGLTGEKLHTPTTVRIFWELPNTFGFAQLLNLIGSCDCLTKCETSLLIGKDCCWQTLHLCYNAQGKQHQGKRETEQAGGSYIAAGRHQPAACEGLVWGSEETKLLGTVKNVKLFPKPKRHSFNFWHLQACCIFQLESPLNPRQDTTPQRKFWLVQSSSKQVKMTRLAAFHDGRPRIQTWNRFAVRVWVHLVLFDTNPQLWQCNIKNKKQKIQL